MNVKEVKGRVMFKGDIEENWNKAVGFIPVDKEIIIYKPDSKYSKPRMKIGNGIDLLANLPFVGVEIEDGKELNSIQSTPRVDKVTQEEGETTLHFNSASLAEAGIPSRVEYGATGKYSVSLNGRSAAQNKHATAIGNSTVAKGEESFAQGYGSVAEGGASFAGGSCTWAKGEAAVSLGTRTQALAENTLAAGIDTVAKYSYQTVVGAANGSYDGDGNVIYDKESLFEVGNGTYDEEGNLITRSTAFKVMRDGRAKVKNVWASEDDDVIAKGYLDNTLNQVGQVVNQLKDSTAILHSNDNHIIYSQDVETEAPYSITIGCGDMEMSSYGGIAIGTGSQVVGSSSAVANEGPYAMAIGYRAYSRGDRSIAIGHVANVDGGAGAIAFGADALAKGANTISIGVGAESLSQDAIALGRSAAAEGTGAIAIGACISNNVGAVAIGRDAEAKGKASISIGTYTKANADYQIAMGLFNVGRSDTIFELGNGRGAALSNAFEVKKDGRVWAQTGLDIGEHVNGEEYCILDKNRIYLGYFEQGEDSYTKLNHYGLKHRDSEDEWGLNEYYLTMSSPEGYMQLGAEEHNIIVGGGNRFELTFPLENGTLATQDWTNAHYYPDLVISTTTEVNSDIQRNGNSIIFYEPIMGTESSIYRKETDEYLHFAGGDGVIFHEEVEVEKDIYEKNIALKDKYISYQEIPWSEFIEKVINHNLDPAICSIEISRAYHYPLFANPKKKMWIDLDTFKNGSVTLSVSTDGLSQDLIEAAMEVVGHEHIGAIYVAFKGTHIALEVLDTAGTVIETQNSLMDFDPENSSDWKIPVISVGIC